MINRENAIRQTKDYLVLNRVSNLEEALKNSGFPINLLASLLCAWGFPYIDTVKKEGGVDIKAGHLTEKHESKIFYDIESNSISGELNSTIKKVFMLVNAIENELTSAAILPPEIREQRIDKVTTAAEVEKSFFQHVLRNWS